MTARRRERKLEVLLAQPQRAALRYGTGWDDVCEHEASWILNSSLTAPTKGQARLKSGRTGLEVRGAAFRTICELVLRARTLRDVRWIIGAGACRSTEELQSAVRALPLDLIFSETPVSVKATSRRSRLYHTGLISEEVERHLPTVGILSGVPASSVILHVDLWRDTATFSVGMGGERMAKRGYKTALHSVASIKEELAACCIDAFRLWHKSLNKLFEPELIYVPFAGSGTLAVESILAFENLAPCVFGGRYAVDALRCAPHGSLAHARKKLGAARNAPLTEVHCNDRDPQQAAALETNIGSVASRLEQLGIKLPFSTSCADAYTARFSGAAGRTVFMPLNPPFGERLGNAVRTAREYQKIGELVQAHARRASALGGFILCPTSASRQAFLSAARPESHAMRPILHGGKKIECLLFA